MTTASGTGSGQALTSNLSQGKIYCFFSSDLGINQLAKPDFLSLSIGDNNILYNFTNYSNFSILSRIFLLNIFLK